MDYVFLRVLLFPGHLRKAKQPLNKTNLKIKQVRTCEEFFYLYSQIVNPIKIYKLNMQVPRQIEFLIQSYYKKLIGNSYIK